MSGAPAPYGATIMEHFRRPRNQGPLPAADVAREGANPLCGDRIRIELALRDGHVVDARFTANACAISVAAASLLTERVRGMSAVDVRVIGAEEMLAALGGQLPHARRACALLPLTTMVAALDEVDGGVGKLPGRGTPG
ncbi:MAG: iron-sulfur cluster assembly scaffold protein [Gemmatimonadota bacterium]|nr:iron-sulfur cluster assembly scaffold protein [Gemmatimonadota bacterium]